MYLEIGGLTTHQSSGRFLRLDVRGSAWTVGDPQRRRTVPGEESARADGARCRRKSAAWRIEPRPVHPFWR